MNQKYVLISMIVILFGITYSVYAEYSPVVNIDVIDKLKIADSVIINKLL